MTVLKGSKEPKKRGRKPKNDQAIANADQPIEPVQEVQPTIEKRQLRPRKSK